jgi:hypothetical protein
MVVGSGFFKWITAAGVLDNGQCGVGLHRRTTLAAMTSWDEYACSGLRQIAQHGWAIWYYTSPKDDARYFFNLLTHR